MGDDGRDDFDDRVWEKEIDIKRHPRAGHIGHFTHHPLLLRV